MFLRYLSAALERKHVEPLETPRADPEDHEEYHEPGVVHGPLNFVSPYRQLPYPQLQQVAAARAGSSPSLVPSALRDDRRGDDLHRSKAHSNR